VSRSVGPLDHDRDAEWITSRAPLKNCELFCKAHSGDAYDLDRIGRPSLHLAAPLLTIGLTVQPSVIAGLAATPAFRTVGLLARFLYALPVSRVGARKADPPSVTDAVRAEYGRAVRTLAQLPEVLDEYGELVTQPIAISEAARRTWIAFKAELEPRLGPGGDLHAMADWGNKLPGLVARLARLQWLRGRGPYLERADPAPHRSSDGPANELRYTPSAAPAEPAQTCPFTVWFTVCAGPVF